MLKKIRKVLMATICCGIVISLSGCGEKKVKEISINNSTVSSSMVNDTIFKDIKSSEKYSYTEDKQSFKYIKGKIEISTKDYIKAAGAEKLEPREKGYIIAQSIMVLDEQLQKLEDKVEKKGGICDLSVTLSEDGEYIVFKYKYDKKCMSNLLKLSKDKLDDKQIKQIKKIINGDPDDCIKVLKEVVKDKGGNTKLKIKKVYYE